ncbi:MAG: hypothetical protein KTR17_07135 [Cellvibrionaceae bacterium]|nr:hypothetical protein [Cellvibrionaceae bacterium]
MKLRITSIKNVVAVNAYRANHMLIIENSLSYGNAVNFNLNLNLTTMYRIEPENDDKNSDWPADKMDCS